MLYSYKLANNKLNLNEDYSDKFSISWFDLVNPTKQEETFVENLLQIEVPTRDELHELELSNRLYQENGAFYFVASIVTNVEEKKPQIHSVSFILKESSVVTLRYVSPYPYRNFLDKTNYYEVTESHTNYCIFLGLVESIINNISDIIENAAHELDVINSKLFSVENKESKNFNKQSNFTEILKQIGVVGDVISKARESLGSLNRLATYSNQVEIFKGVKSFMNRLDIISKDISGLSDHANFLSNKIIFLLDATLGFVNIEQNNIIKIFSIAAVAFLPPTLIASIYGMNFEFLPELKFEYGYFFALILMVISGVIPLQYFRKKGWI
jgi:magnesium transporter